MSARSLLSLSLVAAGVLAPAAIADAATKASGSTGYPTVSKIAPMRVSIGETMTITGRGFIKGKAKNTVVFRRSGRRSVFVKADGITSTRLTVKVPAKLGEFLGKESGAPVGTRFQIRVLAKRFGRSYTALKNSPMVLPSKAEDVTPLAKTAAPAAAAAAVAAGDPPAPPADCDGDGQLDATDSDDDNDLLPDTIEAQLGTNRCLADTDQDGMEDGWEYQSAYDLNEPSCPNPDTTPGADVYPIPCSAARPFLGKRNYPNPLNADGSTDYDGDWIPAAEEFRAFKRKGTVDPSKRTLTNMWYSAGKQSSVDSDPYDGCVGMAETTATLLFGDPEYTLDRGSRDAGNGCLNDGERDEDGDFLTNNEELNAAMSGPEWWTGVTDEPIYRPDVSGYAGTNWLDADTDGDQIVDGIDDQDYDDFWNIEELERGRKSWANNVDTGVRTGLWVDPFNPCLPAVNSRTCSTHLPVAGDVWRPFGRPAAAAPVNRWPLYGARTIDDGASYPTGMWNNPADPLNQHAALPLRADQLLPIRPHDANPANDLTPGVEHPISIPR